MSYPFVQSATDIGVRRGPVLGFVVHHAEGGGTVGYLSRPNPNGVSVHFVIEYTGRTVQMLKESHAHSSIRPTAIRRTDDADGFYGRTATKAVLGDWADTEKTLGPNHATLAVEIEGFAKDGPNPRQAAALIALVADIRARHGQIGLLGHRDFADYKACPGKLIPWAALGGHGPAETDMPGPSFRVLEAVSGWVTVKTPGTAAVHTDDGRRVPLPVGDRKRTVAKVAFDPPLDTAAGDRTNGYLIGDEAAILLAMNVELEADPVPTRPVETFSLLRNGVEEWSATV